MNNDLKQKVNDAIWCSVMEATGACGWTDNARLGMVKSVQESVDWALNSIVAELKKDVSEVCDFTKEFHNQYSKALLTLNKLKDSAHQKMELTYSGYWKGKYEGLENAIDLVETLHQKPSTDVTIHGGTINWKEPQSVDAHNQECTRGRG